MLLLLNFSTYNSIKVFFFLVFMTSSTLSITLKKVIFSQLNFTKCSFWSKEELKKDEAHKAILSNNIKEDLSPHDMTPLRLPVCLQPVLHCIILKISYKAMLYIKVYQMYLWGNVLKQTHIRTQKNTHTHTRTQKSETNKEKKQRENDYVP